MRKYMNKDALSKRIVRFTINLLLTLFLMVSIFSVFVTVSSKRDVDGAAEIFGYQMRVVTSDSMAKCEYTDVSDYDIKDIPVRSLVFVKAVPDDPEKAEEFYSSLKVGDVLTFRYVYTTQVTITHRITSIKAKESGGYIIELAGDNKNSDDSEGGQLTQTIDTSLPHSPNYVLGKVTGQAKWLGVLLSFLMQPIGIVLVIIVPCFIIVILEVVKITRVFSADKKKKDVEEQAKKDDELEALRKKIAELEKEQNRQNE